MPNIRRPRSQSVAIEYDHIPMPYEFEVLEEETIKPFDFIIGKIYKVGIDDPSLQGEWECVERIEGPVYFTFKLICVKEFPGSYRTGDRWYATSFNSEKWKLVNQLFTKDPRPPWF